MSTYFGYGVASDGSLTVSPSDNSNGPGLVFWNQNQIITVPGSGNFNVDEIALWCKFTSSGATVRLAIYNAAGTTLLAYGTAAASAGIADAWVGHTGAGITQLAQLVGGTNVTVAYSNGGPSSLTFKFVTSPGGDTAAAVADYTTGSWPSSLPTPLNQTVSNPVRVGITAAGGGGGGGKPAIYYAAGMRS